jgi:hypothetical protein
LFREGDKDCNETLDYATSLVQLTNTGSSGQEDLIDEVLAEGLEQGYEYELTTTNREFVWYATASPKVPGTTGDRHFGANMAGLIFFNSEGPVVFQPDGSSTCPVLGN